MEFALEILSYVFWLLVALMVLVFVHEMGHFLFAKLFGMRVDRFSIGFPPKIAGKKIGETEYVIGATPLGGYVKISGMVDESMDADYEASEPQPWEFRSKPVWQRIIVITAGVVFNVILAVVIFAGLKMAYGESYVPAENVDAVYVSESSPAYEMGLRTGDRIVAVGGRELERYDDLGSIENILADPFTITVERAGERITFEGPPDIVTQLGRSEVGLGIFPEPSLIGGVMEGSAADSAGIRPGDRIIAIGGQPIRFWFEMTEKLQQTQGGPLLIQWERPDSLMSQALASNDPAPVVTSDTIGGVHILEASVAPRWNDTEDKFVLGVGGPNAVLLGAEFGVRHRDYGPIEAISAGATETWQYTSAIVTSLKRVFTGRDDFRENMGGIVSIAKYTKEAADLGAATFWRMVALLSISLAVMNILPIPALDGGHLMFLIYEGITRREPSLRVRMAMQQVGMIVLLAFMTFLIFNDILKL